MALSAKTGKVRWAQSNGGGMSIANGVLYTLSSGSIFALDAKTGAALWQSNEYPHPRLRDADHHQQHGLYKLRQPLRLPIAVTETTAGAPAMQAG